MRGDVVTGPPRHQRISTPTKVLLIVAGVVAVVILVLSSTPNGPSGLSWLLLPLIGLGSICCWLAVAIHSVVRRRFAVGLVIAPLIGLLTAGLVHTSAPSKARFVLIDRPAFAAVVRDAPAPVIALPDHDLTDDEGYDAYGDFPGPCPAFIGTLHIQDCAAFSAGYLFYDSSGSGLVDDGGIAYLPAGVPAYDVGNGSFESPEFWHLTGPWYAFASSW